MPISEARKRANKKWNDANQKDRYDRVQLVIKKGRRDEVRKVAESKGCSTSAYIKRLIEQDCGIKL